MFTPIQVILLCVLVGVWTWQKYNLQMFYYASVVTMGVLTGLIMGDVRTGMLVGGAMCLMSLGLFGAGGSSVPEYPVGCIAGAAFAIAMGITGQEAVTTAMTIGVPVAALGAQLDVLGKTSGSFFINKMRECSEKKTGNQWDAGCGQVKFHLLDYGYFQFYCLQQLDLLMYNQ